MTETESKTAFDAWVLLAGILLLFALMFVGIKGIAGYATTLTQEPYRSMGAAEVLTEYMEVNNGKWPSQWSDVEGFMGSREFVGIGTFKEFRQFIEIDFQFDPQQLELEHEEYGNPSFDVVRLRSGRRVDGGWNANRMIQVHLLRKAGAD